MPNRTPTSTAVPAIVKRWRTIKLSSGRQPRITPDNRISVLDVIQATGYVRPSDVWERLKRDYPRVRQISNDFQFPGRGQRPTPVTDLAGFLEILSLVPANLVI